VTSDHRESGHQYTRLKTYENLSAKSDNLLSKNVHMLFKIKCFKKFFLFYQNLHLYFRRHPMTSDLRESGHMYTRSKTYEKPGLNYDNYFIE
jgi:hypothetical protein